MTSTWRLRPPRRVVICPAHIPSRLPSRKTQEHISLCACVSAVSTLECCTETELITRQQCIPPLPSHIHIRAPRRIYILTSRGNPSPADETLFSRPTHYFPRRTLHCSHVHGGARSRTSPKLRSQVVSRRAPVYVFFPSPSDSSSHAMAEVCSRFVHPLACVRFVRVTFALIPNR